MAIAGAGPAGCAVAVGLRRLGYEAVLIASPRAYSGCEGVSERVVQALQRAGFEQALKTVAPATPRQVHWNGDSEQLNTERLLCRVAFDRALLLDVENHGVALLPGLLRGVSHLESGVRLQVDKRNGGSGEISADFFVDARGRAAPRGSASRMRGPETLSLLQVWRGPPGAARSAVAACADGWVWLAQLADGTRYTQLTLAAEDPAIPKRAGLQGFLLDRLTRVDPVSEFIDASETVGAPVARSSTSILHEPLRGAREIRVGDAAMAVDPLSGNGIFQALSSALLAPPVINTMLQRPQDRTLAEEFYRARLRHNFLRFARTGRDFYRLESRWQELPFWRRRSRWPDSEGTHPPGPPRLRGIELRAVVEHGLIRQREVVLTDDQPLGVWHVAGVELAPLLRDLKHAGQDAAVLRQRLRAACAGDGERESLVLAWLQRHALLD